MDCDQILENFYLGSCPLTFEDIEALTDNAVTAVLNLQSDKDFQKYRIDWPHLSAIYSAQGIEVRRVPITDFDDDSLQETLPEAVRVLAELLKNGHTVFLHCNAGVNRSPSVTICFLHWIEGWSLDKAEQHVSERHLCDPVMDVIRRASRDWKQTL